MGFPAAVDVFLSCVSGRKSSYNYCIFYTVRIQAGGRLYSCYHALVVDSHLKSPAIVAVQLNRPHLDV